MKKNNVIIIFSLLVLVTNKVYSKMVYKYPNLDCGVDHSSQHYPDYTNFPILCYWQDRIGEHFGCADTQETCEVAYRGEVRKL